MSARKLITTLILTCATLLEASAVAAAEARIAVAAEGPKADAAVSAVAGRAPHILIFDAQGKLLSSQPNPVANSPGGAGPALARWLAEKQVTLLIAGQVGGNMASELKRLNIRSVPASGPADKAVKAAK
jgi:predicted Fe-Mo cluster-binding NifX family protein